MIVAGGLGLAPLRPALYRLLAERERYGRVALLYGARSPDDILFRRELERWRAPASTSTSRSPSITPPADWRGHVGVVTTLIAGAGFDPAQHRRAGLRSGGHDALRHRRACRRRGSKPTRSILSMERNMKCAVGLCGHCQFGPVFVCKDGPVFRLRPASRRLLAREEI